MNNLNDDVEILRKNLEENGLSIKDFEVYDMNRKLIPEWDEQPDKWYFLEKDKVTALRISRTECKNLRLSNLLSLKELFLFGNWFLEKIELINVDKLEILDLSLCNIEDLTLSKLPSSLKELYLSGNRSLRRVDLKSLDKLEKLSLNLCGIDDSSLSKLPKSLKELYLSWNNLRKVDLTEFNKLEKLVLELCPNIEYVKLSKTVKTKISIEGIPDEKIIYE